METIRLSAHEYEGALRMLPNPLRHNFKEMGLDTLVTIAFDHYFSISRENIETPDLKNTTTIRFRLNHRDRMLPFWEPVQEIIINPSKI